MAKGTLKQKQDTEDKTQFAYKYYRSQGWTPEQASGIVGNLLRESNLNPNAVGDGGKARGLAQWHPDRQAKAKELYGDRWTDFENQLKFVNWELNNTEKKAGDKLRNAKSVWESGAVISNDYERPKVKFHADDTRQAHVSDIYRKYSKTQLTDADKQMFRASYARDVAPYMNQPTNNLTNFEIPTSSGTFASVPDVYKEPAKEENKEVAELQQKSAEKNFIEAYQSLQKQPIAQQEQEEAIQPLPQTDVMGTFNQVSSFIDEPVIAQQGGAIYVNSKNDPRYRAYQDSLKVYNEGNFKYNNIKKTGNLKDLKVDVDSEKKLPFNKFIKEYGYNDDAFNIFNEGTNKNMKPISISHFRGDGILGYLDYGNQALYKKPQQPVEVQQKNNPQKVFTRPTKDLVNKQTKDFQSVVMRKPIDTPQVTPLQQIQTKGVVESDFTLKPIDINIPQFAPTPKSFDIEYSAQRMNNGTGYYDQNNVQSVDLETALRAQEQADRMNQYWQEKYGNSQNPKAQERLKQLQDNATITPNYQEGGVIKDKQKEIIEIKQSDIEGKGVFIKKPLLKGDMIVLAHTNSQPSTDLGRFHNHSEKPNSESLLVDNNRYLVALKPLKAGEEITVDYRKQPELEQPESFKRILTEKEKAFLKALQNGRR